MQRKRFSFGQFERQFLFRSSVDEFISAPSRPLRWRTGARRCGEAKKKTRFRLLKREGSVGVGFETYVKLWRFSEFVVYLKSAHDGFIVPPTLLLLLRNSVPSPGSTRLKRYKICLPFTHEPSDDVFNFAFRVICNEMRQTLAFFSLCSTTGAPNVIHAFECDSYLA